jgi:hypothetical protein
VINATSQPLLHWNYFIALERDLEVVSRYVEFCPANLNVFSIELAHLLFAAASEVDVLAKCVCKIAAPSAKCENINHYREALNDPANIPRGFDAVAKTQVSVGRYGLTFSPWENWLSGSNPDWWHSYNKVKHERNDHFHQATLQNALNALGALLILNVHYRRFQISPKAGATWGRPSTMNSLNPKSELLRMPPDYYA